MLKYVIVRLLWLFFMWIFIFTLVYFALTIASWTSWNRPTPDFWQNMRFLFFEYLEYVKGIVTRGDFGRYRAWSLWDALMLGARRTFSINIMAFIFYMVGSILIGSVAALKRNTLFDRGLLGVLLVIGSIPNFVWIFAFMLVFSYQLGWFPSMPQPSDVTTYVGRLHQMVMPAVALALLPLSKFTLLIRNELTETFESDYSLLLKTKGMNEWQMLTRHHLKNAVVPILPELTPTVYFVIAGSFLLEIINNVAGLSMLLWTSLFTPVMGGHSMTINVTVATGVVGVYAALGLVFVFFIDMMYRLFDPRINIGSKKMG